MTRKQKVLNELIAAYYGKKYDYDGLNWISGGWTPIGAICHPSVGGSEGTRRIRELKEGGIDIQWRFYVKHRPKEEKTRTTIYKLVTDPQLIDQDKCELKLVETGQVNFIDSYKL